MTHRITIDLELPEGATVTDVRVDTLEHSQRTGGAPSEDGPLGADVLNRIGTAPPQYEAVLRAFAQFAAEHGCLVQVPQSKRPDYLNVVAPPNCRRRRVASFMVRESREHRGPRYEAYCGPEHAAAHSPAEPDLHHGVPVQCKGYFGDSGGLEAAKALLLVAIEESRR